MYTIHCNYSIMTTGFLSMTHIENGRGITAGGGRRNPAFVQKVGRQGAGQPHQVLTLN